MFGLTLLTKPPQSQSRIGFVKHSAKRILKGKHPYKNTEIDGHRAVTRSAIRGLKLLSRFGNIDYNFNPIYAGRIKSNCWVVSGPHTLQYIADNKDNFNIKFLVAGPNISVMPHDDKRVLLNERIDKIIVPSDWVKRAYIDQAPELKNKIVTAPAGIDETHWIPSNKDKNIDALVYWKTENKKFIDEVVELLKKKGLRFEILKYGQYDESQYKRLLDRSQMAIFISRSESQGLALAEAWSMNVPTLVWKADSFEYNGWKYLTFSSAPYLTGELGFFWESLFDLDRKIMAIKSANLQPRSIVIRQYTDEICTKNVLSIIPGYNENIENRSKTRD